MAKKKKEKTKLTPKQEDFCQLYLSQEFYGNGVQTYIEAYNIDLTEPGAYNAAKASASENLTKPNILDRIDELLEEAGLNDQYVDKQLYFLIRQSADLRTKLGALKEYNQLKTRITKKVDLTSGGEKIIVVRPSAAPD